MEDNMPEEKKETENKETPSQVSQKTEKKSDFTKKIRENPWIVSTAILALLLLVVFFTGNMGGGITGKTISKDEAGKNLVEFLNTQVPQGEVTLKSVEEEKGLYKATLSYQGQEIPMYVTKDGKNMVQGVQKLEQSDSQNNQQNNQNTQNQQDISKSDKPEVELFIMSFCPYGTQAQKGILPAFEALGDKIDSEIRFVNYLMHGEKEAHENTRQYCIQKEQEDKLNDYLTCFLDSQNSEKCLDEAKVDKDKLQTCVENTNEEYNVTELLEDKSSYRGGRYPQYNIHKDLNEKYGVGGSPTLIINGKQVSSSRSPAAYLNTICSAFTEDSKPDVCENNNLSTEAYSPGFGYDVSTSGNTNAQC